MRNPLSENRALKAEVRKLADRNAVLEQDKRDLLTVLDEARQAIWSLNQVLPEQAEAVTR